MAREDWLGRGDMGNWGRDTNWVSNGGDGLTKEGNLGGFTRG